MQKTLHIDRRPFDATDGGRPSAKHRTAVNTAYFSLCSI